MNDRPAPLRSSRVWPALALCAALTGACTAEDMPAPSETEVAEARDAAKALGTRLKSRLVGAMDDGGPMAAIDVCANEAGEIASEVSAETGFEVGRTALRVRNPDNAPDAWEREQLRKFMESVRGGADPATIESATFVQEGSQTVFRWGKPIMLEAPCATCHGTDVDPELLAEIRKTYPEDAATGFEIGEVRGMFTVQRRLDRASSRAGQ